MLNSTTYYHGVIRKSIVAFGNLFSKIYIDRKEGDSTTGTTVQRIQIPLAYAPKEKWLVRLDSDPDLTNHTYTTLPRMSFEILGYNYDPQRKTNRMAQIKCGSNTDTVKRMFSPVPYTMDIAMYVITKTQEDGLQIVEQILPTFTPEYTLTINAIPDMNVKMDVPIILNAVGVADEYDGDFATRRFVTHTLNFQMKINLFGPQSNQGVITNLDVDIGQNEDFSSPNRTYVATGDSTNATLTSESWTDNF